MSDVVILIPSYKRPRELTRAIDSLYRFNSLSDFDLLIVDDKTPDAESMKNVYSRISKSTNAEVLYREENGGFTKAVNTGLREIMKRDSYEYVFLMNNDAAFVMNHGLKVLVRAFDDPLQVGLVMQGKGMPCKGSEWPTRIGEKKFFKQSLHPREARTEMMKESPYAWYEPWVGFWGTMIRTEMFWKYGLLEEKFTTLGQDVDWCHRIRLYGWTVKVINEHILQHSHKTHKDIKPQNDDDLNRDRGLWRELWNPWRDRK